MRNTALICDKRPWYAADWHFQEPLRDFARLRARIEGDREGLRSWEVVFLHYKLAVAIEIKVSSPLEIYGVSGVIIPIFKPRVSLNETSWSRLQQNIPNLSSFAWKQR